MTDFWRASWPQRMTVWLRISPAGTRKAFAIAAFNACGAWPSGSLISVSRNMRRDIQVPLDVCHLAGRCFAQSGLVHPLDDDGRRHAAGGAHGYEAALQIAALQFVEHCA